MGGSNNIGDLDDMNLANPNDGDIIVFNQSMVNG